MTLQPGDKVRVCGGAIMRVSGVAPTYLYLTNPKVPSWAPQRFDPDQVTHVFRDNQWVEVTQ